jgi:hypothetical protein
MKTYTRLIILMIFKLHYLLDTFIVSPTMLSQCPITPLTFGYKFIFHFLQSLNQFPTLLFNLGCINDNSRASYTLHFYQFTNAFTSFLTISVIICIYYNLYFLCTFCNWFTIVRLHCVFVYRSILFALYWMGYNGIG